MVEGQRGGEFTPESARKRDTGQTVSRWVLQLRWRKLRTGRRPVPGEMLDDHLAGVEEDVRHTGPFGIVRDRRPTLSRSGIMRSRTTPFYAFVSQDH